MSSVFVTTLFPGGDRGWSLNLIVHHGAELADGDGDSDPTVGDDRLGHAEFRPVDHRRRDRERRRVYRVPADGPMEQDDLTAFRRGEFLRRAEAALLVDGGRPAALLMMDLDHFKRLQRHPGPPHGRPGAGRFPATAVREMIGDEALFARMGGEEFALLLLDTGRAGAVEIAERISLAAAEVRGLPSSTVRAATVGIGLA